MKKITTLVFLFTITFLNAQTFTGTWKVSPQAGAIGVGPNQGDISWWSNSLADVTARACFFDDEYIFNTDGTFQNVLGAQTWLENWQTGAGDFCGTPVAPHNGTVASTWTADLVNQTITINGTGAYLGIPKAYNLGELTSPSGAPASITYNVTSLTATLATLDIQINGGWWRFIMEKQGVVTTCNNGIQDGDETGVDCGGSCPACISVPMVAAPTPPARPVADVISVYSDAYSNLTVAEWGPNWGPASSRINDFPIQSNPTKVMDAASGQVFAGIDFAPSLFDATSFTNFHLDYWIADPLPVGQVLSIKLSNHLGGAGETSAIQFTPSTVLSNQWVSLDIPLADFVAASAPADLSRNAIAQIVITAARADNNVPVKIYMDNIYFHKNTLSNASFELMNVKMYPNPSKTNVTIEAKNTINNVSLFNVLGQEVYKNNPNSSSTTIEVSNLQNGIYIVKATIDGKQSISKLIKE